MGCHSLNLPFMALKLGAPTSVEAEFSSDINEETYPTWSIVRYQFPARVDLPPVKLTWYDGGTRMPTQSVSAIKNLLPDREVPPSGMVLIGQTGTFFSPDEYGHTYKLLPEERFRDYQPPDLILPRAHGEHHGEWIKACRGEGKTLAGFDYASQLTEAVLLGCVAIRARSRIEWDSANMKITNNIKANDYPRREYRKGWDL